MDDVLVAYFLRVCASACCVRLPGDRCPVCARVTCATCVRLGAIYIAMSGF